MRRIVAVLVLTIAAACAAAPAAEAAQAAAATTAATYSIDLNHSEVSFRIRHFVSKVRGRFKDFSAVIVKDDRDPSKSSVQLTIQAASVDTEVEKRDLDLRSPNFFDVARFPTLTFRSTRIEKVSDTEYRVTGELSIHGVTKALTLPVTFAGEMADGYGGIRAGFSTSTTLNRKDFNITWNRMLDNGGTMLSDEVEIEINLEAIRQQ